MPEGVCIFENPCARLSMGFDIVAKVNLDGELKLEAENKKGEVPRSVTIGTCGRMITA